jgi:hypothetical protein
VGDDAAQPPGLEGQHVVAGSRRVTEQRGKGRELDEWNDADLR